jgi:hypothetical protein
MIRKGFEVIHKITQNYTPETHLRWLLMGVKDNRIASSRVAAFTV